MRNKFIGIIIMMLLISTAVLPVTASLDEREQTNIPIKKIDYPFFSKTLGNPPYWYFGIAFGDFFVNGNFLEGHAKIIFQLYMNYFIFPKLSIDFSRNISAYINYDEYFYYKLIHTNHTAVIIVIDLETEPSTPSIACLPDSTQNLLRVTMADVNIKWRDISIALDKPGATYQVFDDDVPIATINNTASAGDAEVLAGQYIQLSTCTGMVLITLVYIPTNTLLGAWTIDV